MADNAKVTASAEPPRKGTRKVNLNDIQGRLNKRGRERFTDPVLANALTEMLTDGQPIIWDTAVVTGNTDKARNANKSMWRNRAKSVFGGINPPDTMDISVQWTDTDEMVISLKVVTK